MIVKTLYKAKKHIMIYDSAFLYNSKFLYLDVRTGATRPGPEPGSDGRYPVHGVMVTDELFEFAREYFRKWPWTNAPNTCNDPMKSTIHAPFDSIWIDPIPLEEENS